MTTVREWPSRTYWGVLFTGALRKDASSLIGEAWDSRPRQTPDDCPSRPLLFTSRRAARAWCAAKHAHYAKRGDNCAEWRFRPVRVRERFEIQEGR